MRFTVPAAFSAVFCFGAVALTAASVSNAAGPIPGSASTAITLSSVAIGAQTAAPMLGIEPAVISTDKSLSFGTALPQAQLPAITPEAPAASLAALVDRHDDDVAGLDPEMRCLATAIFYEARSESLAGKLAVARVVINRAGSGRFPSSMCGVVTQRGQFSFVRGGQLPAVSASASAWHDSVAIARVAMNDEWESQAEGALYFHASRVSPGWGRPRVARIDNHIFYR